MLVEAGLPLGSCGELRGKDSNLEFQGQNLASCRLLHPAETQRV
jgi:hypothetical protein